MPAPPEGQRPGDGSPPATLRARTFALLDGERSGHRLRRVFDAVLIALIVASTLAVVLETVPSVASRLGALFVAVEVTVTVIFSVEYAARVWAAPDDPRYAMLPAWKARLRHVASPLGIVDLLAVAPFYVSVFATSDMVILRLFRLIRLLKLTHYSPALATLAAVLHNERKAVIGALFILAVLLVTSSAILHLLEREAQPDAFGTIPQAMWWAMATLTTVGYGDVTPLTPGGRIVGSVVMMLGIGVFVLWTSIFAAGFLEETRRRSFVVTWNLVARVPAFATLDASRIAEITRLLQAEIVPPRYTVIRRGEIGDCMYFVVSGELEVDLPDRITHVHEGHFFGEAALLENAPRAATVIALTECQLLRLDRGDFEALMDAEPLLRQAIARIARGHRSGAPGL